MTAKATTGVGSSIVVNDYMNVMLDLSTASSANLTVKIQGSYQDSLTPPTFSSAASGTNRWFYVASYDLSDPTSIVVGNTGYSASGTDIVKGILVNTNGLVWLNCQVTARSAGNITIYAMVYTNQ